MFKQPQVVTENGAGGETATSGPSAGAGEAAAAAAPAAQSGVASEWNPSNSSAAQMEGASDSVAMPPPRAACMGEAGQPATCGDGVAAAPPAEMPTKGEDEEVPASPAAAAASAAEPKGDSSTPASTWDSAAPQLQQQQLQQQQQSLSQPQALRKAGDEGGTNTTVNNGGGGTGAPSATPSHSAQSSSPAAGALSKSRWASNYMIDPGDGLRALEEEVRGLDADWDELQKLHDMTEEAAYSLIQSGGGSPHAAHPGSPNAATAATAGSVTQGSGPGSGVYSDIDEVDRRSVYVGNVEYSSTPAELQEHFKACGTINRITIMVDKFTGHPKGYAYIEFNSEAAVQNAILLSDTVFKHRQIKVVAKRKNIPGFARARGSWRGGRLSMAGGGGMPRGPRGCRGGFRPIYRPRGGYMRGYGRPY